MKKSTTKPAPVNPDQTALPLDRGPAWVIYVLCDPRVEDPVQRVRYVGFTSKRPKLRIIDHLGETRSGTQTHKCNWLRGLLAAGLLPVMDLIDPGTVARSWQNTERAWIKHFRDMGCPLTNLTDGGEGTAGCACGDAKRIRQSEMMKEKYSNPENRAAQSMRAKEYWNNKDARKLKSIQLKELYRTNPDLIRQMAERQRIRMSKPENRAILSLKATGRKHTEQSKSKMAEAKRGKQRSAEDRAKISEGTRKGMAAARLRLSHRPTPPPCTSEE